MKQKQLLRTLLAAVCLLVGTSAWGDVPTYTWDFTNTTTWTTAKVSTGSAVTLDPSGATPGTGEYGVTFDFTAEKGEIKSYWYSSSAKSTCLWWNEAGTSEKNTVSLVVPAGFKVTFNIIAARAFNYSIGSVGHTTTSSSVDYTNDTENDVVVKFWATNPINSARRMNGITSIVLEDYSAVASHTWSAKAYATINDVKTEIGSWNAGGEEYSESEEYNVWAKKVISYGGHYYELNDAKFSANAVYFSTTMGDDDAEHEITYTLNDDIAYYAEGEDINSAQKQSSETSSNASFVYYMSGTTSDIDITDAGVYRLETFVMDNDRKSKTDINVYNGEDILVTIAKGTAGFRTSESFTLAADAKIKIGNTGNNSMSLDYILVRKLPFAEGKYYLKNKGTGAYFAAGQNWSTQAITNNIGHVVGLEYNSENTWNVNTYIYGNDGHYLNGLWCDQAALGWIFTDDGEGYCTISSDGTNFITAGAVGAAMTTTTETGDNTKWQLLTEEEWKAEQVARLNAATYISGVDATFYLPGANFNRRDNDENNKWQGTPGIDGLDQSDGCNFNAEKFNTTPFDVYHSLTGVKPGIYKVTCQGFYRNGTTDDRNALLYANSYKTPLVNIKSAGITVQDNNKGFTTANGDFYVPNTQAEAAKAFNNGYYGNNELWFVVGDDGALRIGVKKETGAASDWALFDNFQLTYYGENVSKTITDAGWATLYTPYALDFSTLSESLTAYTATFDGSTVELKKVTDVPANTGVVLKGSKGVYNIPLAASSSTAQGDLKGSPTWATNYDSNYKFYYLALNAQNQAQFKLLGEGGSIAAGKAYLQINNSGNAKALSVVFANDPTGITNVNAAEATQPAKRIVNGQLVIEKNGKRYNAAGAEF